MSLATDLLRALIGEASPLAGLREDAARLGARVAFCEADDPRIAAAAIASSSSRYSTPIEMGTVPAACSSETVGGPKGSSAYPYI